MKLLSRFKKLSVIGMLLSTLTLCNALVGCAKNSRFDFVEGQDFKFLNKDEVFTAPKSGAYMSDLYLEKIAGIENERDGR